MELELELEGHCYRCNAKRELRKVSSAELTEAWGREATYTTFDMVCRTCGSYDCETEEERGPRCQCGNPAMTPAGQCYGCAAATAPTAGNP